MWNDWTTSLAEALGAAVVSHAPLSGGCVGEVYKVALEDGRHVVVKVDGGSKPCLDIEGYMLGYLAAYSALPVPAVLHSAPELLAMEFVEGTSSFSRQAEEHAADLLADLHGRTSSHYGLERDTLIGGLHQPNTQTNAWLEFFRDQRLFAMGRQAVKVGRMGEKTYGRLETFAGKLSDLLEEGPASLLHGDVWSANVLSKGAHITGFVDPAVYYGHAEIELAFITMFSTFGEPFFRRYNEHRPIAPGFFETRRDIYNLYPLLVHVTLFGGGYLSSVERVLERHGC